MTFLVINGRIEAIQYNQAIMMYRILKVIEKNNATTRGMIGKKIWEKINEEDGSDHYSHNELLLWRLCAMGFLRYESENFKCGFAYRPRYRFSLARGKKHTVEIFRLALRKLMLHVENKQEEEDDTDKDVRDAATEGGAGESPDGEEDP